MVGLTMKQAAALTFIKTYISEKGYSPSYEDIGIALNLSSLATVCKHVQNLKIRGYIDYARGTPRSITVIQQ